ncbi:hypothetical protein JW933_05145, partial [candidate division FCPU426 bacterium]|nr:hypothetical protein [candidate division FCPU426 bacterium]
WDGDETAFSEKDWYCYFFAAEAAYPMAAGRRRPSPNIRLQSFFQRFQIICTAVTSDQMF